jgi:hypothetical protein
MGPKSHDGARCSRHFAEYGQQGDRVKLGKGQIQEQEPHFAFAGDLLELLWAGNDLQRYIR